MKPEERYEHYYNEGYNAGSVKGYDQAIKKACEWLELNVCNAYNFRGDDISIGFVEQFRKAMESGC